GRRGGGRGWGGGRDLGEPSPTTSAPLPNPPPQGGREHTERVMRCCGSIRQKRALVAAEGGRLRPFSGPDLPETHGLQCRRRSVRPDQLVFENARVRAASRNAADEQIGARRRAGRGDPRAGGSIEWLELGDLAEVADVVVAQRALQIDCRAPVQCGAARKDFDRAFVSELADDNALGAAERAGEPPRREGNTASVILAERSERGGVHGPIGS